MDILLTLPRKLHDQEFSRIKWINKNLFTLHATKIYNNNSSVANGGPEKRKYIYEKMCLSTDEKKITGIYSPFVPFFRRTFDTTPRMMVAAIAGIAGWMETAHIGRDKCNVGICININNIVPIPPLMDCFDCGSQRPRLYCIHGSIL